MSQALLLPGLEVALDLARNQEAYYSRKAKLSKHENPDSYEDMCAGIGVGRVVEKLEAAIAEAKRQRGAA